MLLCICSAIDQNDVQMWQDVWHMRRSRVSLMFSLQYVVFSDLLRYRPRDPFVLNDKKAKCW